jgi:hypothetical protein
MPLLYNYSHTYELEYSYYVMILIYELAYSLCVMRVLYLTLCLTTHITYIIGIIVEVIVHHAFGCAQVLYLLIRRVGDLGGFR